MKNKILATLIAILLYGCTTEKEMLKSTRIPIRDTISLDSLKQRTISYEIPSHFADSANFFGGALQPGSLTFIYDDSSRFYKDSLLNSSYDFTLSKNDHIHIAYYLNQKLILGAQAYDIYYAKVTHNGLEYWGYIPEHKLSLYWKFLAPLTFLYVTVRDHDKDFKPMAKASLYKNGEFINEISFAPAFQPEGAQDTVDYSYCLESSTLPEPRLVQIQQMIKLNSYYPACGYSSGESLILYDGSHIHYGMSTSNYFDAGIVANYSNIEAPQDTSMAKKHIFVTVNNVDYMEESDEVASHDSIVLDYEWTHENKLIFVDTLAKVKIK